MTGIHEDIATFCKNLQDGLTEALAGFAHAATLENAGTAIMRAKQLVFHGERLQDCRDRLCEMRENIEHLKGELQRNLSLARNYIRWSGLLDDIAEVLANITRWEQLAS